MYRQQFMREAIALSRQCLETGDGGPFGAVIIKDGEIVGRGRNLVTAENDPTAHAELVAIRNACRSLGRFSLKGCELYTSCEPCPMCLGAVYWSRLDRIYAAASRSDAAAAGFDDSFIYDELEVPAERRHIPAEHYDRDLAVSVFREWQDWDGKIDY